MDDQYDKMTTNRDADGPPGGALQAGSADGFVKTFSGSTSLARRLDAETSCQRSEPRLVGPLPGAHPLSFRPSGLATAPKPCGGLAA